MARVAVYGKLTGDQRAVSLGGRSRNNRIESWINFDYFKVNQRESKRAKKGYIEYKENEGTGSITTIVNRAENGSTNINIYTEIDFDNTKDIVNIRINGIKLVDLLSAYNKEM